LANQKAGLIGLAPSVVVPTDHQRRPRHRGGLPQYVERDFARYLECGVLAHGFARVRCESCKDELLVAFSYKGRGVCLSCNAKRAHVTAAHLVERVLPHVPYRQWNILCGQPIPIPYEPPGEVIGSRAGAVVCRLLLAVSAVSGFVPV